MSRVAGEAVAVAEIVFGPWLFFLCALARGKLVIFTLFT